MTVRMQHHQKKNKARVPLKKIYTLFLAVVCCTALMAQQTAPASALGAGSDSAKKRINILHADKISFLNQDSLNQFQILSGNVSVQQDKTLFYCDSASLNTVQNVLESFGHVHINDADSLHVYSDYLKYLAKEKKATLTGNVKLTDGKGTLTTKQLDYDLMTKISTYKTGGKVVNGKSVLTSEEGTYYEETRDVYFKKNVLLNDPEYNIKTDTLLYNTYSSIATFIAQTKITSDSGRRNITTTDGYYDTKNKKAYFGKRPQIQDRSTFLIADEVANDDSTGFGEARGSVIYRDTAQNVTIIANHLNSNRKNSSFLATEKPVMILKQDADSIFVAADTLYSAKLSNLRKYRNVPSIVDSEALAPRDSTSNSDSADRFFEAYYHVKIYSDSLQAVGDSLFYSLEDSAFRLFKQPVVWTRNSQVTGDTIYLYTQKKKPSRLYVFENAMSLDKVGSIYYNQVKGRTINGFFKDGNIDWLRAKGNSESIYYAQDEGGKFIGVNRATADIIDMYFLEKKPERVVFRSSLVGTTYPMRQVVHEEMRLRGFKWQEALRPKTKYDLFGN